MGATTTYGLRYPEATDPPRGDEQLQALAEDIETAAMAQNPDTGSQINAPVTPGPGWELLIAEYRLVGKVCTLHLWIKRTGEPITSGGLSDPTPGNIIGDPVVATVTDPALRPSFDVFGKFRASFTDGSVGLDAGTGEVDITTMHSGSTIETYTDELSSTIQVYLVYPIP